MSQQQLIFNLIMDVNRKNTIYFISITFIINYQKVCSIRKETIFKLTTGKEETEIIMKAAETYIRHENGGSIS